MNDPSHMLIDEYGINYNENMINNSDVSPHENMIIKIW